MLRAVFRNAARALRGNMSTQTFKGQYRLRLCDEFDKGSYSKYPDHFVWAEATKLGDDRYSIQTHIDQEGYLPAMIGGRHFTENISQKSTGRKIFSKTEAVQILHYLEDSFQKDGMDGRSLTPVTSPVDYLHFKNIAPEKMKP